MFKRILEYIVTKLERRIPASKAVKAEDLILSNASLDDIKRGINKIYNEVNAGRKGEKE